MAISFGYIRVSSQDQHLDRQYKALESYVTDTKYIYSDKASGKDFERDGFQNMLKAMRAGDILYIKSIDRLGRNKAQIKEYLEYFKREKIRVKIIDLPTTMADVPEGQDWVIEMINNIIIEVYTSIAQQERETIKQRQREGIDAAKEKGKHLGRPVMELPADWDRLYSEWKAKKIMAVEFMAAVNMKKATFYKKVKEYEASAK
ncbi:recombinase family protein [Bacillus thuringiensis]|uniref:recombinase family protein n=1 Tax=Bacillus thuringiensis TaxID=1428 RepID=UPI0007C1DDCC|nr:recombinase family protein [Bacillus thuringiensis]AND10423.1 resolvase [Bacillus thuringiensis serovar alesti]MEC3596271.1 recombinase family protein [Bacillus thuringiensis]MED1832120.1 recombinase family protein [Bacillus thuringiensis]MED2031201.1 recombinase family protein [Bacillus thuringiensis]MED2208088.1 recombinase family protein [Bacillus thuringiensis]